MELIDLGLLSGVLWANTNLGCSTEYEMGDFYRFGENTPFTVGSKKYNIRISEKCDISGTTYDVVANTLKGKLRLPTREDVVELAGFCEKIWENNNGYGGYRIIGPNGNSIFLPVINPEGKAGRMFENGTVPQDGQARYWTSLASTRNFAFSMILNKDSKIPLFYMRQEQSCGALIHPVANKY